MKYIDAEKLKVEIDRQEIGYNIDGKHDAEYDTCVKIVRIIDSLQQELPEVNLENEIAIYFQGWTNGDDHYQALNAEGECVCVEEIIDIARHFFNLGLNARKEE